MNTVADRLATLMREREIGQSELARRVGVGQAAISKIISGDTRNSRYLLQIARELGTTPDYLTGDIDDPGEGARQRAPSDRGSRPDMVGIENVDFAYGLGATFSDNPVQSEVLDFPRVWIEAITSSPPRHLSWARGRGDSMAPTIHDGDIVLLDRSQRRIESQDELWAFSVGDLAGIKRLRIKGDRLVILSDNPAVPADEEPIDQVNIVARVIFIGKRT